jgi:phosphate starvation-inducible protein PhoH and related proteins
MAIRPVKKANTKFLKSHEIDDADTVSFIKKGKKKPNAGISNLQLQEVHPLTKNQGLVFDAYANDKHIVCAGSAGTGKTFCLLYLMLQDLVYNNEYEKIIIIRSAVPTRNIGFLPGTEGEKMEAYEIPYKNICNDLFGRADAYEILKKKDLIEFQSTSYIRGTTFDNMLILVDEFENCNFHESDSIITRCGKNTRIFFSGDFKQTDLDGKKEISGYKDFMKIISNMESFAAVEFTIEDCVRSGLVREYLIEKDKLGM